MASSRAETDHVAITMKTYNAIASEYGVTAIPELRRWKENSMRRFGEYLRGKRVLVPGCGDGRDSRYLAQIGIDAVSFDLSPAMLEQARQSDPTGDYRLLDLRDIAHLTDRFDGIWAAGCLYHLRKIEFVRWLESARELLNTGGVLYLSMKEGSGETFEGIPGANYPGGEVARERLRGERFYAYYTHDELVDSLDRQFTLLHEQRPDFGERNFEFWVQRRE